MTENSEQLANDLDGTADVIEAVGWSRGDFEDHKTREVCLLGGMRKHLTGEARGEVASRALWDRWHGMYSALTHGLKEHQGASEVSIAGWNDWEAGSQAEVVELLRDLAIKHRPDETRGA